MPLAFSTESHGEIPIGFFNIETDMFMINDHFIFASDLCESITKWTGASGDHSPTMDMYIIEDPGDIGDLMGAIRGIEYTGFIGELYKLYPFPSEPVDFKQNPEGAGTRQEVVKLIVQFGKKEKVDIIISEEAFTISIGKYIFNKAQFHEVIAYIWRGGMPMWKNEIRPTYVEDMMKAVLGSEHWLFKQNEKGD